MKLKDVQYGWVIVIVGAFILAAYSLVVYTFGVFLRPLTMEFNWDRGALSGAFSLEFLLSGLLAIPTGRINDKYGPRLLVTAGGVTATMGFLLMSQVSSIWQVYLNWGVLLGVTGGCCYIPISSTIPRWFQKKRGTAVGIAMAGFGIGGMVSSALAQWLISSYGWQQAFVIMALIVFVTLIPLGQFMKHSPQRMGLSPYGGNGAVINKESLTSSGGGLSFKQAIKAGCFWLFGLILFFSLFAIMAVNIHIVAYAVDIGISGTVAASILSVILGASVIGKFFMGFISDRIGARRALTACLVVLMLSLTWLLFAREIWMFYLFAIVCGISYGGIVVLQSLIAAELFGLGSLGIILGGVAFFATVGGAIGPFFAGTMFDVTGGYSIAFLVCVIGGVLSIILSLSLLKAKGFV